ncbi:MAG TPA: 4-hydroxy-tetrahydrodipicolinate reductase, partial [Planctomycetes bacterium]|nr:4-hydroxy-tetrahydrodipicolinate reductase [Planctomycetota bacterium]
MPVLVAVVGAAGRMGRRLVALINADKELELIAAVEAAGCIETGRDVGAVAGIGDVGVPIREDFEGAMGVIIDFSVPEALPRTVAEAVRRRIPLVVGTTGLGPEHNAALEEASAQIPLICAPNFSVGVNLLFKVAEQVAWTLGDEYDVEIVEVHHRYKTDAPSGTALGLAKAVAAAREVHLDKVASFGRHGRTGERPREQIGIHAVRAG